VNHHEESGRLPHWLLPPGTVIAMWWDGPYQGMGHWMGWGMPFFGILLLIVLVLVIVGLVALARRLFVGGGAPGRSHSSGLDILEERYAKGEMNRDEYLQKKRDLGG
jgi:putative membrane protein